MSVLLEKKQHFFGIWQIFVFRLNFFLANDIKSLIFNAYLLHPVTSKLKHAVAFWIDLIYLTGGKLLEVSGNFDPELQTQVELEVTHCISYWPVDSESRYISCQLARKGWWNIKSNVVFVETTEFLLQSSMTWFEVLMLDPALGHWCRVVGRAAQSMQWYIYICYCNMTQIIMSLHPLLVLTFCNKELSV